MRLLVSTGNRKEYVEGRNIEIPANSIDYVLKKASARDIIALKDEPNVTALKIDYELGDLRVVRAKITGQTVSGVVDATVLVQLVDQYDVRVYESMRMTLGVFEDAKVGTTAINAILAPVAETKGLVVAGANSPNPEIETDANGEFECLARNAIDARPKINYLSCRSSYGSGLTLCDIGSVTYNP